MSLIEVRRAAFAYDGQPVFSGIDLSVEEGDFAALIGANGSGKSTLFRMLLGELEPTQGEVRIGGQRVRHGSARKQGYKIGYIPQIGFQADMDFPATVNEMVMTNLYSEVGLFGRVKSSHREKARKALELTGMEGLSKVLIQQLSGGQRQRVLLSRVLVDEPDILLLDEPTAGVDEENVRLLFCLLSQLNQDMGITILMITHDLSKVAPYVSRVFCMAERSVVELDREQIEIELSHKHKHPEEGSEGQCCEKHCH